MPIYGLVQCNQLRDMMALATLLDHLVGAAEKHRWNFESKRLKSMLRAG